MIQALDSVAAICSLILPSILKRKMPEKPPPRTTSLLEWEIREAFNQMPILYLYVNMTITDRPGWQVWHFLLLSVFPLATLFVLGRAVYLWAKNRKQFAVEEVMRA